MICGGAATGAFERAFGSEGEGEGDGPVGSLDGVAALLSGGRLAVADTENQRVAVLATLS